MNATERKIYWSEREKEAVKQFINECCDYDKGSTVKSSELYEAYHKWCMRTGNVLCLIGKNKFIALMESYIKGNKWAISSFRTNKFRGWMGIGLRGERNDKINTNISIN